MNEKFKEEKSSKLHPRNKHSGRYDFDELKKTSPELSKYLIINDFGNETISFFDPLAVKALNKALLMQYYNIGYWDIPEGYLCPPIPGRADHIHTVADILIKYGIEKAGNKINVLDIGVGANCIYPIIGNHEYSWKFTGTDVDKNAIKSAQKIIDSNKELKENITLRHQPNTDHIFNGVFNEDDQFDISICNPPFHSSANEASKGSIRKIGGIKGIKGKAKETLKAELNFGGKSNELWYEGGEITFIIKMIDESSEYKNHCKIFTTLVSKETNLPAIYKRLKYVKAMNVLTSEMAQGNKVSRIVSWTY